MVVILSRDLGSFDDRTTTPRRRVSREIGRENGECRAIKTKKVKKIVYMTDSESEEDQCVMY